MKKQKITFAKIYLCYFALLTVAVIAAIIYVNGVLHQYEDMRPETRVQEAVDRLAADASKDEFWNVYNLPEIEAGKYEEHLDLPESYRALYTDGNVTFSVQSGKHEEDELFFVAENNGCSLAEIKLKATGPAITKLGILNVREWEIASIKPILESRSYTVSVPDDFAVAVNEIPLTEADGVSDGKMITYTVEGVYLEPVFDITNQDGKKVEYTVKDDQVIAKFYDYELILPRMLTVEVDGEGFQGQNAGNNSLYYEIRSLEKPDVVIRDCFGNDFKYEGGDKVPLTYMTITADSRYDVKVMGASVPKEAVTVQENSEYKQLKEYVNNLPQITVYDIAVLEENAEISVADEMGNPVKLDKEVTNQDFIMNRNFEETVPDMISSEIDVLDMAQNWSLFMSKDLTFSQIKKNLIADSYQYNVAVQYATGVDITFTSTHSLGNPAFTEEKVGNFYWITDDCFAVDISFVKHMVLRNGKKVDDYMNDRFYFVKYDDTDDNTDNPEWKLAAMKEIVNNAQ